MVYELYDLAQNPIVYYQDAMREEAFKQRFSFPPVGTSPDKWTWHDKTAFPWSKVMKTFDRPKPEYADVHETLTAAARVAADLRLRAANLKPEDMQHRAEQTIPKSAKPLVDRIQKAIEALFGE